MPSFTVSLQLAGYRGFSLPLLLLVFCCSVQLGQLAGYRGFSLPLLLLVLLL